MADHALTIAIEEYPAQLGEGELKRDLSLESALPAPLTPPECDLRDFPFLPLDVARLRRSKAWLKAQRKPALGFYAVNLWTASWHEVPAGSLEDDDDVLADLAMCHLAKWRQVREEVLRGWLKCSDGRLYHAVVAEKARCAWDKKLQQRWRTECGRIKKHNQRHEMSLPIPGYEAWLSAGRPQGQPLPVPGEPGSKGEGEGQGQGQGQGQGDINSGANAPGGKPPRTTDPVKQEIWGKGRAVLRVTGMGEIEIGKYLGMLIGRFTPGIVLDAVRATAQALPDDPKEYLMACCQRAKGQRTKRGQLREDRLAAEFRDLITVPEGDNHEQCEPAGDFIDVETHFVN